MRDDRSANEDETGDTVNPASMSLFEYDKYLRENNEENKRIDRRIAKI
jgi:hypothetical protein